MDVFGLMACKIARHVILIHFGVTPKKHNEIPYHMSVTRNFETTNANAKMAQSHFTTPYGTVRLSSTGVELP